MRLREVWRDDLQCYLLLWFAFVFAFFSLSGTKLPHYALYGMSGMFVLMAAHAPRSRFWSLAPALIWFAFLLFLPWAIEWIRPHVTDAYYREALSDVETHFGGAYYAYAAVALAATAALMLERRYSLDVKLIAVGALFVIGLSVFLVPIGAAVQQEPIKQAALLARSRGWEVIMWRLNAPSFSVYYGRPTTSREPKPGDLIITKSKRLQELPGLRPEMVYVKNGIVLARVY
jgi:4-amino-4-deoxy-L-arabinose transferase-like glycosyltransferase